MADSNSDLLISWLNDAYGMETNLVQVLEHQVNDAQDYPQVQARLQQHLEQTRHHAELVKQCVQQLGGDVSSLKAGMSGIMGKVQALSTEVAQDEMIKNALQDYAAESFEVASYTSLIKAAYECGEANVATICQQILQQDRDMQQWIEQNIPTLTVEVMQKVTGVAANA